MPGAVVHGEVTGASLAHRDLVDDRGRVRVGIGVEQLLAAVKAFHDRD